MFELLAAKAVVSKIIYIYIYSFEKEGFQKMLKLQARLYDYELIKPGNSRVDFKESIIDWHTFL